MHARYCLLSVLSLLPAWTQAAEPVAAKFADPAVALPGSGVAQVSQVSLGLVAVLAIIFVIAWLMRRLRLFPVKGQATLQVVQGLNLGPKERAVILTVENRRLLLGVAPGCVNLLAELSPVSPSAGSDAVTAEVPVAQAASEVPNFKSLLKRSMGLS